MMFDGPSLSATLATGSVAARDTPALMAKSEPTTAGARPMSPVSTSGSTVMFAPAIVAKKARFATQRRRSS
jgi:hypothetical protein